MNAELLHLACGVQVRAQLLPEYNGILSLEALNFVKQLHERFESQRQELLENRKKRSVHYQDLLQFPNETHEVRKTHWTVAPLPSDLLDRRVEITGPVDRKMIVNALNSGAKVFMADFEDSNSPTWTNLIEGQINLYDAIRKTISLETANKTYTLNPNPAVLMVRPRGLHMTERHVRIDGQVVSASLFDFGLFAFHNALYLLQNNSGPYFYLPKIEHYTEARWWNEVFVFTQKFLGIDEGSIKATVLIETLPASFQLDEILYELRMHSAGLNCGRWDYMFSFIKTLKDQKDFTLPDRDQITMSSPFMRAYTQRVVQVCHKRGVHAMGGMAAQIPIKDNPSANELAFEKVKNDKLREVKDGHDGTWVAHPALVKVAMEVFNEFMPEKNQIHNAGLDREISASELLLPAQGSITLNGLKKNINVGIQYLAAWLSGQGAAAINHLMEDAATAEISRTQVWLWIRNGDVMEDGQVVSRELFETVFNEELSKLRTEPIMNPTWMPQLERAAELFRSLTLAPQCIDFLTLEAYNDLE